MPSSSLAVIRHQKQAALLLAALVWALLFLELGMLYQERLRNARAEVTHIARALAAHVGQTIEATDIALDSLARAIAHLPPGARQPAAIDELLRDRASGYDSTLEFAFLDARGKTVAASQPGFIPGRDFSDRDYFQAHYSGPDTIHIGGPLRGRTFGKYFFPLSRAVRETDGRFGGVIMGSIEANQFAPLFERFSLGPQGAISLMHDSGRVITRSPDFERHFGQDVSRSPLFTQLLPNAPEGDYEVSTATDGVTRLIHYVRVGKTPLLIAAGVAREDIVARLHKDIAFRLIIGALSSLLITLATVLLGRKQGELQAALVAARQSESRYRGLYDSMADGVLLTSQEGLIIDANLAFGKMIGKENQAPVGAAIASFWQDDDPHAIAEAMTQMELRGSSDEIDRICLDANGQRRYLRVRVWRSSHPTGQPGDYWMIVRDVTEQRAMLEQLNLSRKVIENTSEAMLVTDTRERILAVNPAFEQITGHSASEAIGKTPRILSSGRHSKAFYQRMWEALKKEGHWSGEIWDKRKSGEIYPKILRINAIRDDRTGQITHYAAVFSDISDMKAHEEKITYLAHHDPLTGLPNREALRLHLDSALTSARRNENQIAILFIDLDNFKNINDSLGHHAGDALLCEVARRLSQVVRESDKVARLGGDEFVVILEGIKTAESAAGVAQKLIASIGQPCLIDGQELHTSPSIGISLYPADGQDAEVLMRNADTAMYVAKSSGRNNYQFFAEPMNEAANQRLSLESELWRALSEQQMLLYYQPQIELASGRIVGVEALVRWQHPKLGLVLPAKFIPVAEECGFIQPLGQWILANACRQARRWLDEGRNIGCMAVNISPQQFRHTDFAATVRTVLEETGLPPEHLELEITESVIMLGTDAAVNALTELAQLGVKLAIDDFGTGQCALSALRRFPIDRLKIDGSFIAGIENDAETARLTASIIALGRSMGLKLIAEGIENGAQVRFLRENHCEFGQGYHFFAPSPADRFADALQPALLPPETPLL